MSNHQKKIEQAFYSDGFKLGMEVVQSGNSREVLIDSVSKMYESIDSLIEALSEFAGKNNQRIDCKKGCHWCCHQPVFALDYELKYLNDFVIKNFEAGTRNKIKLRAESKRDNLIRLNEKEILNSKYPCPLLEEGACIAYSARPMACRIYLSGKLHSCLDFFHHPEKPESIPALFDLPLKAGRMMNEGFKSALRTEGKIAKEFRIEEKLLEEVN